MKFIAIAATLILAVSAQAQSLTITSPANNQAIHSHDVHFLVDLPSYLHGYSIVLRDGNDKIMAIVYGDEVDLTLHQTNGWHHLFLQVVDPASGNVLAYADSYYDVKAVKHD